MLATSNSNNLVLYDPYNLEKLACIQAHATSIKYLMWRGLDSYLITSCESGNIFVWNTKTLKKEFEYFILDKNQKILALEYDSDFDLLVYSVDDMKISMIYEKGHIEILCYDMNPY